MLPTPAASRWRERSRRRARTTFRAARSRAAIEDSILKMPASGRWVTVFALLALYALSYVDRVAISLLIDPIKTDLGLTDTQMGLVVGAGFAVTFTLLSVPIGILADRISRRLIIASGLVIWSLGTGLCGLATTMAVLIAARALTGVGEASLTPCGPALIAGAFPPERRALPIAVYVSGIFLGGGITFVGGATLMAALTELVSELAPQMPPWRIVFFFLGALGLPALLLVLLIRERARPMAVAPRPVNAAKRHTIGKASAWALLGTFIGFPLITTSTASLVAWSAVALTRDYGFTLQEAGLAIGLTFGFGGVSGALASGGLVDFFWRRGRHDAHYLIVGGAGAAIALTAAAVAMNPGSESFLMLVIVGLSLGATSTALQFSAIQAVTPPELRGRVLGGYAMVTHFFPHAMGGFLVGFVSDAGLGNGSISLSVALVSVTAAGLGTITLFVFRPVFRRRVAEIAALETTAGEQADANA